MEPPEDPLLDWAREEFKYTDEDLAANRQGLLSSAQRKRLTRGGLTLLLTSLLCWLPTMLVLVVTALQKGSRAELPWGILMGVILTGIYGAFAWTGWRSFSAGRSACVRKFSGVLRLYVDEQKKKLYLEFGGGIQLEVQPKVEEYYSPGIRYRVYYCDKDRTILSMEH